MGRVTGRGQCPESNVRRRSPLLIIGNCQDPNRKVVGFYMKEGGHPSSPTGTLRRHSASSAGPTSSGPGKLLTPPV